jgi:SAM-dependent methyltransferase
MIAGVARAECSLTPAFAPAPNSSMSQDPYADLASIYDLAYGDYTDDVLFYENLANAAPDDSVLELGVGTGRVALPLARAGFRVFGIDRSEPMLEMARANAEREKLKKGTLELAQADMTDFGLGRRFGMVFVAANTFQHLLTVEAQRACLERVAAHLLPGGLFAMSVRSLASVSWEGGGSANPLLHDWTRRDPDTGDLVQKFISMEPDAARMTRLVTYMYDRIHDGAVRRLVFQAELRYSTAAELQSLLQDTGLRVTHLYGDYDLSPMGHDTENMIFVAKLEGRD